MWDLVLLRRITSSRVLPNKTKGNKIQNAEFKMQNAELAL